MIFIGGGAHISRAVEHALGKGHTIDLCFVEDPGTRRFCDKRGLRVLPSSEVNQSADVIAEACSDGIVFSLNNTRLLKPALLDLPDVHYFGIHSGIIPRQKGNPVICAMFAILEGHEEYGVSLFRLDAGIDTGAVLAIERFPMTAETTLEGVLMQTFPLCQQVFETHLDAIVAGDVPAIEIDTTHDGTYLLRHLAKTLPPHAEHPDLDRALHFGMLARSLASEWKAAHAALGR